MRPLLQKLEERFHKGKVHGMWLGLPEDPEHHSRGRWIPIARSEFDALKQELEGLRAFKQSVDEALNQGNGSYRP